ncbi:hypothetical protein BDV18DRAFT_155678 [Aspergillus unguis]
MKATFLQAAALAVAKQASAVLCLAPDIRADSNRDGVVDTDDLSDSQHKALWASQHGAIFLPNIGDKHSRCSDTDRVGNPWSDNELAACHDASGHLLHTSEYVVPLKTLPLSVSERPAQHTNGSGCLSWLTLREEKRQTHGG